MAIRLLCQYEYTNKHRMSHEIKRINNLKGINRNHALATSQNMNTWREWMVDGIEHWKLSSVETALPPPPPKPWPPPPPGHERFGSMLLRRWLGLRGRPLTRWWTERPCSGVSGFEVHAQLHSRSMRNVSSVAGSARTMSGSLSMCSPSSVKGSIFNSSNGNWESASKLTSPTLANELVSSLERLGGDSPVTNVRQTKRSAEMPIPGNQCWESYFANVIGYRLHHTLFKM